MACHFKISLGDRTHTVLTTIDHHYVLSGETLLRMETWPAWCSQCAKFVEAERVPSAQELDKDIAEAKYYFDRPGLIPQGSFVRLRIKNLEELRLQRQWRSTRISPSKCLNCFGENITLIWPEPEVDIPGIGPCVGEFRGWADVMKGTSVQFYTSEGSLIPESDSGKFIGLLESLKRKKIGRMYPRLASGR
jgi:hypothetical protein